MSRTAMSAAILALVFVTARPTDAQPPPDPANSAADEHRLALAREVVQATGMEATMTGMVHNMAAQMTASMGDSLSAERQARLKVVGEAEGDAFAKLIPQLERDMEADYARTFTEQELSDMLAFYRSPSGRSMVAKMPDFMRKMVAQMAGLMPQLRRDMGTEICARLTCTAAERAVYFGPPSAP